MVKEKKTIILSVGGSLIVPNEIDTDFLKKFKRLIVAYTEKGYRFVIVAGGGKTCRNYQQAARSIEKVPAIELDWIGVYSTWLNASLLKAVFHTHAHSSILTAPKKVTTDKSVIIAGGWKPGWSTDYVATRFALLYGAEKMVNLSNIDYVYDKDPRTSSDAQPFKTITWPAFRALLPKTWDPGLSSPFDPIAARLAQKADMEVVIVNGEKQDRLASYLDGKNFVGTRITL